MPIGVIVNVLAVAIGGLVGTMVKDRMPEVYKVNLNMLFGLSSMGLGILSVILAENMPAVILSVILGTILGLLIHLSERISSAAALMNPVKDGDNAQLITVIVLFCASGTGIYGAMVSGMSGDHGILISKSILDFFTALIFACSLGSSISKIAIPQGIVMLTLFFLSRFIFPLTTPTMINDFKACGGMLMIATGFRILQLRMFPTADMIPAMALVMPLSALWTCVVIPLVS